MAIPVIKLNLAPPSTFWRLNHGVLGWSALALGGALLAGSLGLTWSAYQHASQAGKLAGSLGAKARATAQAQAQVVGELRSVDVARELPRWRLAERIYTERSLPWSRLTAELERSLVKDVRLKSLQRNRGADLKVQLKLKGEARSREAEAKFVESLEKNAFFDQVILEREAERQGGGVEFDYTLTASNNPPPYKPLPKVAAAKPGPAARPGQVPARPAPAPAARPGIAVPPPVQPRPALPPATAQPPQGQANPDETFPPHPLTRRMMRRRATGGDQLGAEE
jgi:hypothetical protein